MLIITAFAVSLIFTYVFRIMKISGESMKNTLMPDDRIVISTLWRNFGNGDVVVIKADEKILLGENGETIVSEGIHDNIVKRIIASGGQTVDIDFATGAVFVDGERISESYVTLGLTHLDMGAFTGKYPVTVPEGCFFVMGDYRSVSVDSRSADIGFVSENSIIGKMIFVL
ncbi:MAG: signal peptidase I [Ruminococcus sp.]|nr:signal peptidase I [Ruminococcus sp.]